MLLVQNDNGLFVDCVENGVLLGELRNVHAPHLCADRGCAIHNHPSEHPLNASPLNWREDMGILERLCEHRVGHPDADSALYLESIGQGIYNVHACDGCCATDEVE